MTIMIFVGVAGPCIMLFKYNIDDPLSYFLYTLLFAVIAFFTIDHQVIHDTKDTEMEAPK